MWLAAMAGTFVGDIADVIRIDTLRSTPLILDGSKNTKPADGLLLDGLKPSAYEFAHQSAVRNARRNGAHVALPRSVWCPGR
jgi:hypothetical protein